MQFVGVRGVLLVLVCLVLKTGAWAGTKQSVVHTTRFGDHSSYTRIVLVVKGAPPVSVQWEQGPTLNVVFAALSCQTAPAEDLRQAESSVRSVLHEAGSQGESVFFRVSAAERLQVVARCLPDSHQRPHFYCLVLDLFPHPTWSCVTPPDMSWNCAGTGCRTVRTAAAAATPIPIRPAGFSSPGVAPEPRHAADVLATEFSPLALPLAKVHEPSTPSGESAALLRQWWRDRLRFSGKFKALAAQDLHGLEEGNENEQALHGVGHAELRYTLEDRDPLSVVSPNAPYVVLSGQWEGLGFRPGTRHASCDIGLHEAYAQWAPGPLEFRVGKQIVRWGKTDEISPVDVLNAQDRRLPFLESREERKRPNWMLRARLFQEQWTAEGVVLPVFEPDRLHYFGSNWALYRHLKTDLSEAALPRGLRKRVEQLDVDTHEPVVSWDNLQAGARITSALGNVDLGVSYFYGFDPRPCVVFFPVQGIRVSGDISGGSLPSQLARARFTEGDIEVEYVRSQMVGAEFEATLGAFGVRGETAYSSARPFLSDSLDSRKSATLASVVGVDYQGQNGWYANAQGVHEHVLEHQESLLFYQRDNYGLTAEVRNTFGRGKGEIGVRGMYYLSDGSRFGHPYTKWELLPNLDLELGAYFFAGDSDTLFGWYDDNDLVSLEATYHF